VERNLGVLDRSSRPIIEKGRVEQRFASKPGYYN
jgi:hypothetical protein